jgi:hypothetical protein
MPDRSVILYRSISLSARNILVLLRRVQADVSIPQTGYSSPNLLWYQKHTVYRDVCSTEVSQTAGTGPIKVA